GGHPPHGDLRHVPGGGGVRLALLPPRGALLHRGPHRRRPARGLPPAQGRRDGGGRAVAGARVRHRVCPGRALSAEDGEPFAVPITGELDLHAFAPRDIPDVVAEYVRACREKGILRVRLIHGRGRG